MKRLVLLLLLPYFTYAQEDFKPGKIDRKLVEMSICPYDSSAGAFYIFEYGRTRITATLDVEFEHVVQIKIVNKSELKRGDVSIPYPSGLPVTGLKAFTYNIENGEFITTKLDKSSIFKEKVDENSWKLTFSMPNVREGSVIEYSYKVKYGDINNLNTWYFQTSIPVLRSEYEIIIPEYFNYKRNMTGYISLVRADIDDEIGRFADQAINNKHHYYKAINVPAFDSEDFIRSKSDVISKINFVLRAVDVPGVFHENYLFPSYGSLSNKLMENSYWSREIDDAPWAEETLTQIKGKPSKKEEAEAIFNYIKNFSKADESAFNLKSCFKNQSGTDTDLNRTLIAVMRQAGFDADPVLIRTRNRGRLDYYNPMRDNFNFTIARLKIDEKSYLLDASEKDHLFGVLPHYCLNGKGLVVKKGPEEWVSLDPYKSNMESVKSRLELDEEGILTGNVTITRKGYTAWNFDEELEEEGKDNYVDEFEKTRENWMVENHSIEHKDKFTLIEDIEAEMEGQVEDLGNLIYLNPIVYTSWTDHPFKGTERIYPIDFGVPFSEFTITQIALPESLEVEALPEATAIALPGNAGSLTYSATQSGNRVLINLRLVIKKTEFMSDEYPMLREFFTRIIEKSGEQIVLKRI